MISNFPLISTDSPTLCVIYGPTAVGKTDLAIQVAEKYSAAVVSADSRQFYKEMSIGTAKPTAAELARAPHYFVGHLSIEEYYSVSRFEQDVLKLLPELFRENPVVVMVGGSGLYIDAVCKGIDDLPDPDPEIRQKVLDIFANEGVEGLRHQVKLLDPVYYNQTDIANPKRLIRAMEVCLQTGKPYSQQMTAERKTRDFNIVKYALIRSREELIERINHRVDVMMELGLLEEARLLLPWRHLNALNTVGYKELFAYFDGKIALDEAVEQIKAHTRRYAKRQMSWMKRDGEYMELTSWI
ncbi:tRNA (adenosine(37)-N6)-dimethylallyltransferase MiaA [Bacteroidales bacterium OttesenSCG-928-B11]|nr:tRNA (adenosine(37)-N6)-dimethylallyltransferase MiaA [Bacteroidales bacterium OttesenSCG-928-E04]MDL2308705.1 tRNA (adenosine(37)-N6)-dimethylallyltransferase MiaA [Bacteroidales bacterium OttesenSCG-928-C03]MDL2311940.1 tRNA (adenosine(37)-N6)-dimethylallyltransferase MiaA [Bacteroidales bacterium OttesenSCG-928-B11]